jgi:hypothetical protein
MHSPHLTAWLDLTEAFGLDRAFTDVEARPASGGAITRSTSLYV